MTLLGIALVLLLVGVVVWAIGRADIGRALVGIGAALLLLAVVLGAVRAGTGT